MSIDPDREPSRRFVLGLELDGVCADFYGRMREIAAEWLGVGVSSLPEDVSYGLPEWGIRQQLGADPGGYDRLHRFAVTHASFHIASSYDGFTKSPSVRPLGRSTGTESPTGICVS